MTRFLLAVSGLLLGGLLTSQSVGVLNGAFFLGAALATGGLYCALVPGARND